MSKSKIMVSLAAFATMVSISSPAYAYLDPATGSIMLQALLGVVASASIFFRTSLYRVRALFAPKVKADATLATIERE